MKPLIIFAVFLVATCTATLHSAISTQFQKLDPHSHTYSYGYADPNSQKQETRSHDGVTRGSYSYVDGSEHVQSISYTADPHNGFNAVGTNLPKSPTHPATHFSTIHAAAAHSYVPYAQHYPQHIPVLTHNGVPIDTPEVQNARAEHYAAYAAAAAAASTHPDTHDEQSHHLYKRSLYGHSWNYAHQNTINHFQLTHDGVPVDTPDVQAAKAAHFAAHLKARSHAAHAHGVPVDTPEVTHAKAAHYAALAAARVANPVGYSPINGYHLPVIHNGVPIETPEVQHAKASHYAALAEAAQRAGHGYSNDDGGYSEDRWDGINTGRYKHQGPIHIPVIHNGVPVEPPEVQHARIAHLNALAAAGHNLDRESYYGQEDDGKYHPHHY